MPRSSLNELQVPSHSTSSDKDMNGKKKKKKKQPGGMSRAQQSVVSTCKTIPFIWGLSSAPAATFICKAGETDSQFMLPNWTHCL